MFKLLAYLVITLLILAAAVYVGWRLTQAVRDARPKTRVIGPDDDPEFLRRLSHGDDTTKS